MKFTVSNKKVLTNAVDAVSRFIQGKVTQPILAGIYMEAQGDKLKMVATNMETGAEYKTTVSIQQEGATVIQGRVLSELMRKLPDDIPVSFDFTGEKMVVTCGKFQSSWPTMNPLEFPQMPDLLQGENDLVMTVKQFREMVRLTAFAAHSDESRPWFTGILWDMDGSQVSWVCTDTHRLAKFEGQVESSTIQGQLQVIIHAKTLANVVRLLGKDEDKVTITFTRAQAIITANDLRVVLRIIEGKYPNYRQVLPKEYKSIVRVSTGELLSALDRVSLIGIGQEGSKAVKMTTEGLFLSFEAKSLSGANLVEQISCQAEGENISISYDYNLLLDGLNAISGEELEVKLVGSLQAFTISAQEAPGFLYLVVPIRAV